MCFTGDNGDVIIEIQSHKNKNVASGIAMTSTRGKEVIYTKETLKIPLEDRILGRVFDMYGKSLMKEKGMEGGERSESRTFRWSRCWQNSPHNLDDP